MKFKINFIYIIVITIIFSVESFSQNPKFFINADFANFRYDNTNSYLEFYYSFNQSQFKFQKTNDGYLASAIITLIVKNKKNDSIILANKWRNPIKVTDTTLLSDNNQMTGIQGFKIPFGEYNAFVSCYDENNPINKDSLQVDFKASLKSNDLSLSDIQLSSQIQQVSKDDKNIFYKNTLEVIPHPSAVFGIGLPIMFIYLEAYNLTKISSGKYLVNIQVFDVTGKNVRDIKKYKTKRNESSVEVYSINCSDLPSGSYLLKFILSDSVDLNNNAISMKKFYIYNPQVKPPKVTADLTTMITDEYGSMTEEEIDREFETVKYIALPKEKDEYSGLKTLEAKKTFMVNFWRNRDLDDDPTQNIYKDRYKNYLRYVNQNYRTGQKEGWKTDRGRVYLMYGQPDEIERHPNEMDSKPYEIWYYHNLDGGSQFVFIDRSSMGDYILVHSTYRNEISDTNWERLLK